MKDKKRVSPFLTVDEVAELLQFHRITLYRATAKGQLHPFKVGRIYRFDRKDIENLANSPASRPFLLT